MSSWATAATLPSPAGPRSTPSVPVIAGRPERYQLSRRKVWRTPETRMCASVSQWSRANVNVASGAAPRKETYTIRSTPAATAASTAVMCSRTRSGLSCAETRNRVCAPASARRIASPSP